MAKQGGRFPIWYSADCRACATRPYRIHRGQSCGWTVGNSRNVLVCGFVEEGERCIFFLPCHLIPDPRYQITEKSISIPISIPIPRWRDVLFCFFLSFPSSILQFLDPSISPIFIATSNLKRNTSFLHPAQEAPFRPMAAKSTPLRAQAASRLSCSTAVPRAAAW